MHPRHIALLDIDLETIDKRIQQLWTYGQATTYSKHKESFKTQLG